MDVNKEEATLAKNLAEAKMSAGDFVGARDFVTRAQRLFPNLGNIPQMIAICDVHSSAAKKINDELDNWYGILQVQQFADADTIKKQFRNLTLLLHPDKNQFAGSEAAFKLVVEANRVLSDQSKRSLYDDRYAHHSLFDSLRSYESSGSARLLMFWTFCKHCGHKNVYYNQFMNTAVVCFICKKSFIAGDQKESQDHEEVGDFERSMFAFRIYLEEETRERHAAAKRQRDFIHDLNKKRLKKTMPAEPDHIDPNMQDLAIRWKRKIITVTPRSSSSLEVLDFLQFIAAYKLPLSSIINQEETTKLASSIAHYKQAPMLFKSLFVWATSSQTLLKSLSIHASISLQSGLHVSLSLGFCPKTIYPSYRVPDKDGAERLGDILELVANYNDKLYIDIPVDLVLRLILFQRPGKRKGSDTKIRKLAFEWKKKIKTATPKPSSVEVLSFLHFIVAFGLQTGSIIKKDETARFATSVVHCKQAPTLFHLLGLDHLIPEVVEELIKTHQYIPAVRFICFFELEDFSPLHLLKKEISSIRTESQASDEDGGKLRDILELVADHKLEIDTPGEVIASLMGHVSL